MKKINVLSTALFLSFFGLTTYAANTASMNTSTITVEQQDVVKTVIEADKLPDAVKEALKSSLEAGWAISEAVCIEKADKKHFQISLKKGDESKSVNISPEGEILK